MPAVMLTENDRGRRGGRRVPEAFVGAAADLLQEDAAEAGGGFVSTTGTIPRSKGTRKQGSSKVSYAEGFTPPGGDQLFAVGAGIYVGAGGTGGG